MVMVRTKMAETLKEAVTFIEQVGGWVHRVLSCRRHLAYICPRAVFWLFVC